MRAAAAMSRAQELRFARERTSFAGKGLDFNNLAT
jgi:hypothetical protein